MAFTLPTGLMANVAVIDDYTPDARTRTVTLKERSNPFDVLVTSLAATWSDANKRSGGARIPFDTDEDGKTRGGIVALFADAAHHAGYSYRVDDKANVFVHSLVKGEEGKYQGLIVLFLIPKITRTRKSTAPVSLTRKVSTNAHEGSGVSA